MPLFIFLLFSKGISLCNKTAVIFILFLSKIVKIETIHLASSYFVRSSRSKESMSQKAWVWKKNHICLQLSNNLNIYLFTCEILLCAYLNPIPQIEFSLLACYEPGFIFCISFACYSQRAKEDKWIWMEHTDRESERACAEKWIHY